MGRIFFNEDPNHFIFSRMKAGYEKLTMRDVRDFIMQYEGTQITDFFVCLNASIAWYDAKKTDNIIDQYKCWLAEGKTSENESDPVVKSIRLLVDFYEEYGVCPQKIWIDTLREIGIRPWISIRMNDIHESDRADSILFSDFYRKHREKNRASHRKAQSYYEYGLNYHFAEVRKYYLTVIEEALSRFDVDGIELDWMREIYSIGIGREHEGIAVINSFMRDVYAMVKDAESRFGHKIMIAVRLPDSPEKALRLGFDVFDWIKAGIVNHITVTPRWSSTDNDMPIDLWRRILDDTGVTLAAGLEILLDAYNRRGRKYLYNTFETVVGSACAYYAEGADAIYLFNYMDMPFSDEIKDTSICSDKSTYRKLLRTVGDYDRCAAEKRRHVVTYDDVSAIGAVTRKPLPLLLAGKKGELVSFSALRVPTGKIDGTRSVRVILGFAKETEYCIGDVTVYLSARPCRFVDMAESQYPQYDDMDYYIFEAENNGALPEISVIEIGLSEGKTAIHWAEIIVQ